MRDKKRCIIVFILFSIVIFVKVNTPIAFSQTIGNSPPEAFIDLIDPNPAFSGEEIAFSGFGTDIDGSIVDYSWRSSIDGQLSNLATFNTSGLPTGLSEGIHTIYFKVQDNEGTWSPEKNAILVYRSCSSPIKIMPLGNSITHGYSFGGPVRLRTGYRQPLWISLKDDGYNMDFVGSRVAGNEATPIFDHDNDGHGGWRDDEIANGRTSDPGAGKLADWLIDHDPDIVLLHIGTNGLDPNPSDVETILNIIDAYSEEIIVILARIINRNVYSQITTDFNDNVQAMAEARIVIGDKIRIVDMEDGAGIDYRLEADGGDMVDNLHPNANGYAKMAVVWFEALDNILPPCIVFSPFIFTHPNTSGAAGSTYTYQVGAIGSPQANYSFLLNPVGMSIDPVTGLIQWTPDSDQVGLHDVVVQAQNAQGVYTQNFTVSITRRSEIIGTWSSGIWYWDVAESKWTQMTSYSTQRDIAAGDFTSDGKADVASNWSSGLWYQNGATLGWTKVSSTAFNSLTAGDATGDGRSEIIGTWSSGIWYWDVATSSWTIMYSGMPSGDIAAGDFTGDGKADVASNWSSGLWYQNGATLGWTKVSSTAFNRLTAGDVTGDGRSEIIGTWSSGIWYWDVAASSWAIMYSGMPSGDIAAGDFSGDGKADVASNWSSGLWYQNGATLDWTKVSSTASNRVTAGDVTGN